MSVSLSPPLSIPLPLIWLPVPLLYAPLYKNLIRTCLICTNRNFKTFRTIMQFLLFPDINVTVAQRPGIQSAWCVYEIFLSGRQVSLKRLLTKVQYTNRHVRLPQCITNPTTHLQFKWIISASFCSPLSLNIPQVKRGGGRSRGAPISLNAPIFSRLNISICARQVPWLHQYWSMFKQW